MRSSIKMDLQDSTPVIKVLVSQDQSDLRDKVTKMFFEGLGHDSVILMIHQAGESLDDGQEALLGSGKKFQNYEIYPLSSQLRSCRDVVSYMSETQLSYLREAIHLEILMRERGVQQRQHNSVEQKADSMRSSVMEVVGKASMRGEFAPFLRQERLTELMQKFISTAVELKLDDLFPESKEEPVEEKQAVLYQVLNPKKIYKNGDDELIVVRFEYTGGQTPFNYGDVITPDKFGDVEFYVYKGADTPGQPNGVCSIQVMGSELKTIDYNLLDTGTVFYRIGGLGSKG